MNKKTTLFYKNVDFFIKQLNYEKSKFKDFAFIDLKKLNVSNDLIDLKVICGFYCIMFNKSPVNIGYGGSEYNLNNGSLSFVAPNQIAIGKEGSNSGDGWIICFSSSFIRNSNLINKIEKYNLFSYEVNTALNPRKKEIKNLKTSIARIKSELNFKDQFSQEIICNELETILLHSSRILENQFLIKVNKNTDDILIRIEKTINHYYDNNLQLDNGLPKVNYISKQLNLSSKYLSSIVKEKTGIKTIEYIHRCIIDRAKTQLLSTNKTTQQIAYSLGFSQPHYFIKIFKRYNDTTPKNFRNII